MAHGREMRGWPRGRGGGGRRWFRGSVALAAAIVGAARVGHALGGLVVDGGEAAIALATPGTVRSTPRGSARSRARLDADVLDTGATARRSVSMWRTDLRRTHARLLDAWLARPETWRGQLVPILEAHEVPPEFLYLALLESGMDPDAVSPARAVGLWQFTESTAREYGLLVGDGVDQRLDWRLSTSAAGRYLHDLYDLFGTWELAAAAYNGGPGRVSRALELSGADTYWGLVESGRLPVETRDYVPKFLAIVELARERAGP